MKSRLTLIFAALVVLLGGMIWMMQDRLPSTASVPAPVPKPTVTMAYEPIAQTVTAPTTVPTERAPATQPLPSPMVHVGPAGEVIYVARAGDTASQLAIALLGSDSKEHREAVIAANPSLQTNPDRVLEGSAYTIEPAVSAVPASALSLKEEAANAKPTLDEKGAADATTPKMKYTALAGDTVRVLASNLLGGDTQANRDAIIASNPSLQRDPDHMVAGQSYSIRAPNGLAADPHAVAVQEPTGQPDADDLAKLSMGRTLRYTAKSGDTVSKLAVVLLGSDTSTNRDLIIKSNASLKQDPDHLVAGRTYWIAAPTIAATP